MSYPRNIRVVEVGPRDGLQIEPRFVPTDEKIRLINGLIDAGLRHLEATAFVSPRAVPQMADAHDVVQGIDRRSGAKISALVPNPKGTENAVRAGVDNVVIVVSASECHNRTNLNRSVADSLAGFADIVDIARGAGVGVHCGVATSFGCPFEGDVPLDNIFEILDRLAELEVTVISLADTTGMASPPLVEANCAAVRRRFPRIDLGLHFHNTRGIGLVNVMAGLGQGVARYESSVAGLGGCPFAPGATGNICTEDLVNLLHELGLSTGIDLDKLIGAARGIEAHLGRALPGQVMKAGPRLTLHELTDAKRAVG